MLQLCKGKIVYYAIRNKATVNNIEGRIVMDEEKIQDEEKLGREAE